MKATRLPIGLTSFCDEPKENLLFDTFATVNDIGDDYLELTESSAALAAAEVVVALLGKPSASLPDDTKECIGKLSFKPDEELLSAARKAVERVKTDSELKELWDESDDAEQWQVTVEDLAARLK